MKKIEIRKETLVSLNEDAALGVNGGTTLYCGTFTQATKLTKYTTSRNTCATPAYLQVERGSPTQRCD